MPKLLKYDFEDADAKAARDRVSLIIDSIPPEALVESIKRAPSLRGMILGYITELMFEQHVPVTYAELLAAEIASHDDHDRTFNKSDRTIKHGGRLYRIQLKSIQTNSIKRNLATGTLQADVQNDASDSRRISLPNGSTVVTTCYARGDYDILAVPLFPFTGQWDFAYKRNIDCRPTSSRKYDETDRPYLLSTTEIIHWPLAEGWHDSLFALMDGTIGIPFDEPA